MKFSLAGGRGLQKSMTPTEHRLLKRFIKRLMFPLTTALYKFIAFTMGRNN